ALRAHRETFKAIGQLRTGGAAPSELLRERARLGIDLARQRALVEAVDAGRRAVIEQVRTRGGGAGRRALARTGR
ncbi:MAG: hypothetical protein ABEN55_01715, partial [Bradymonadaceae bacterium]